MLGRLSLMLGTGVVLAGVFMGAATAKLDAQLPLPVLSLVFKDSGVSPRALPKNELVPVGFTTGARISTTDGSHPPALREAILAIDKNVAIDAKGLPVCGFRQLEARETEDARRVCRKSIVGSGNVRVEVAYPENTPIQLESQLTLFNGGVEGGTTKLFIHAFFPVRYPEAIVARVEIKRKRQGRYGRQAVVKIPPISGGSGSVLDFRLKVERIFTYKGKEQSYMSAKCPDGHLSLKVVQATFRNERDNGVMGSTQLGPPTVLAGSVVLPCTPRG